jgi:hypothetical protein
MQTIETVRERGVLPAKKFGYSRLIDREALA